MIDNTDEKDIELMFAEARRYDLLTAEQEQQIDAAKWQAVRELYALIANEEELSDYLATFCDQCLVNPPQIQRFPNRDLHFVLRRELAALFSDGSHSAQSREAAQKLGTLKTPSARLKNIEFPSGTRFNSTLKKRGSKRKTHRGLFCKTRQVCTNGQPVSVGY